MDNDTDMAAVRASRWAVYEGAVEEHEESAFFVGYEDACDGDNFQKRCDQQRVTRAKLDAAVRALIGEDHA